MDRKRQMINEDAMSRSILETIRRTKENEHKNYESGFKDAIAITNDPKFGQDVLKNQIDEFKSTVDGGAQFSSDDSGNPENSPLVYMPNDGNLVFSGTIPSLNNLKWQFKLKDSDGSGLFIWVDGFRLNKENIKKLNKLHGHYINWKTQWEESIGMLETLGKKQ